MRYAPLSSTRPGRRLRRPATRVIAWASSGGLLLALGVGAARPANAEVQVNTYTTGDQFSPAVAAGADGTFVVVWRQESGSYFAEPRYDLLGRRFSPAGQPLGEPFVVSPYTSWTHSLPAIAADAEGNFVVVWRKGTGETDNPIWGRRFDAAGQPRGAPFRISTGGDYRIDPDVASDAAGNFVVAWGRRWPSSTDPAGVHARRFDATGLPLGEELVVATSTSVGAPKVAIDSAGGVLVTWKRGDVYRGIYDALLARGHGATGESGPEFVVSTATAVGEVSDVAAGPAGQFVVTWGEEGNVLARTVDLEGATGEPFAVNTRPGGLPSIGARAEGAFTIAWVGADGDHRGAFGQRFTAPGVRDGGEFRVNSYTTGYQGMPAIASQPDGRFLVAWTSGWPWIADDPGPVQDGHGMGVFGQVFRDALFADGFDSGGLGAWSSASTDGGDLAVQPRLDGEGHSFALRGFVDDTAPLYVQDDTPQDEGRYRAAFELDPSGFDPGEANGAYRVRIFLVLETNPTRRLVALVLKRQNGQYSLRARVRLEDHSHADTPFVPISDGAHDIELDWIRSTRPDSNDGSFSLWIDGALASRLTGLDNTSPGVEAVRLGALSIKQGASGTLLWDTFVSNAWSPIGPGVD